MNFLLLLVFAFSLETKVNAQSRTSGNCSPIIKNVKGSVRVTIKNCKGIPKKALRALEWRLARKLQNYYKKLDKSLQKVSNSSAKVAETNKKLVDANLYAQEEIRKWQKQYYQLKQRIQEKPSDPKSESRKIIAQALVHMENGELEKADKLLAQGVETAKQQEKDLAEMHYLRGGSLSLLFKEEQALREYERAYYSQKTNTDYGQAYASSLHSLNYFKKATLVYKDALKIATSNLTKAVFLNNLGGLYQTQNNMVEAEKAYKEALQIYRQLERDNSRTYSYELARTLSLIASVKLDTKKNKEALKLLKESLLYYQKANSYTKGELTELITELQSLIEMLKITNGPSPTRSLESNVNP